MSETTEKPLDYSEIIYCLRATHRDTWPTQTGFGDLINPDGPEAADAIAALTDRIEALEAALRKIYGLAVVRMKAHDATLYDIEAVARAALKQD